MGRIPEACPRRPRSNARRCAMCRMCRQNANLGRPWLPVVSGPFGDMVTQKEAAPQYRPFPGTWNVGLLLRPSASRRLLGGSLPGGALLRCRRLLFLLVFVVFLVLVVFVLVLVLVDRSFLLLGRLLLLGVARLQLLEPLVTRLLDGILRLVDVLESHLLEGVVDAVPLVAARVVLLDTLGPEHDAQVATVGSECLGELLAADQTVVACCLLLGRLGLLGLGLLARSLLLVLILVLFLDVLVLDVCLVVEIFQVEFLLVLEFLDLCLTPATC